MMGAVGWIVAVVLVALVLPLGAMLYFDILTAVKQTEKALQKIEKIEKRIERKERDKVPDTFADNPWFDRVRRPFSLSLPRSTELGKTRM